MPSYDRRTSEDDPGRIHSAHPIIARVYKQHFAEAVECNSIRTLQLRCRSNAVPVVAASIDDARKDRHFVARSRSRLGSCATSEKTRNQAKPDTYNSMARSLRWSCTGQP
jgi:hypothetical protein